MMQWYNFVHQTWWWTSTRLRCIRVNQLPAAEHEAIFSWDPYQLMGNPSNYMGLSIHCVRFYDMWWRWRTKPNLKHYTSIAKRGWFLNSPLRTSAIHNQKFQSTETMQQLLVLQTRASNGNDLGPRKWNNFWTCKKDAQDVYSFKWYPGMENLANYQSKHHPGAHHTVVWPYYLHKKKSPLELLRATTPSTLKGCVGTLKDGYIHNVPLPRVPQIQSASHELIALKAGIQFPGYLHNPSWIPMLPKLGSILKFSQGVLWTFSQ